MNCPDCNVEMEIKENILHSPYMYHKHFICPEKHYEYCEMGGWWGKTPPIKYFAIQRCLEARLKAVCRKTMVGAALYSDNEIFAGWNIENRCQKGYHAEEVAVLNAQIHKADPKSFKGIIVSFSDNDIDRLTFMCGICRQYVWEYTLNPMLLVTEVDLEGNIIAEQILEGLYKYPYPRAEQVWLAGRPDKL